MKKNKITKLLLIGGLSITMSLVMITINENIQRNNELKSETKITVINQEKILEKETVIKSLTNISKLEISQADINKSIKIRTGNIFKKEKDINFDLTVKYILDLNKINKNNIFIDSTSIVIYCATPEVTINFNENLTTYAETEKGFLTFGDIELTIDELESIKSQLKTSVYNEMTSDENIQLAKDSATKSIKDTLSIFTNEDYEVIVRWLK